jgi:hypothetical protein
MPVTAYIAWHSNGCKALVTTVAFLNTDGHEDLME